MCTPYDEDPPRGVTPEMWKLWIIDTFFDQFSSHALGSLKPARKTPPDSRGMRGERREGRPTIQQRTETQQLQYEILRLSGTAGST